MKVLMINGSPHKEGCTYTALKEMADKLNELDIETEIVHVGNKAISGCMGCGGCRRSADKSCVIKDDCANEIAKKAAEADGIVIGSPVHYAAASGQITSLMHRVFYSRSKELVNKPGCAVVSCRRGGASAAFDQLNKYFAINNMPIVTSQYWNQVHGNTPEEVRRDKEGMQTMRTLAVNMAWLLKCLKAADEAGVAAPVYEPKLHTNFIE